MKKSLLFLQLTLLAVLGFGQHEMVLRQAMVVDPDREAVELKDIYVADGKIKKITDPNANPGFAFQGTELDLDGKFLIPGLIDLHVHGDVLPFGPQGSVAISNAQRFSKHALYAGVMAFLDLNAAFEDLIFDLRDQQRAGAFVGAEIHAAGYVLTPTHGHGTEYGFSVHEVNTPADAWAAVTALMEKDPDVIKIVYEHSDVFFPFVGPTQSMNYAVLLAGVEAAHFYGKQAVVHATSWMDFHDSIQAGADAITHLSYDNDPLPEWLVHELKQSKTLVLPTLNYFLGFLRIMDHPAILDSPLLAGFETELIAEYKDMANYGAPTQIYIGIQQGIEARVRSYVPQMLEGGVLVGMGTDTAQIGGFGGHAVHQEMEIMVDTGCSPWQALRAATTNSAPFLGKKWGFKVGAEASFLVVNQSPLEEIANTQDIHLVIQKGQVIDRAQLLLDIAQLPPIWLVPPPGAVP